MSQDSSSIYIHTMQPFSITTEEPSSFPSPTQPTSATVPSETTELSTQNKKKRQSRKMSPVRSDEGISSSSHIGHSDTSDGPSPVFHGQPTIFKDAKYNSFDEFRVALQQWMLEYHHPFRVASSELLKESDGSLNELFRYRYIVYHCAHYGEARKRGVGKRSNQSYLPCGCTANLRLYYSFNERCLKITKLKDAHINHEISADAYSMVAQKIRKSPQDGDTSKTPSARGRKRTVTTDGLTASAPIIFKRVKKDPDVAPVVATPIRLNSMGGSPLPDFMSSMYAFQQQAAALAQQNSPVSNENQQPAWPAPPPNLPARPPAMQNSPVSKENQRPVWPVPPPNLPAPTLQRPPPMTMAPTTIASMVHSPLAYSPASFQQNAFLPMINHPFLQSLLASQQLLNRLAAQQTLSQLFIGNVTPLQPLPSEDSPLSSLTPMQPAEQNNEEDEEIDVGTPESNKLESLNPVSITPNPLEKTISDLQSGFSGLDANVAQAKCQELQSLIDHWKRNNLTML